VICLLLAFAWPWVNQNGTELRDRYAQRSDLARVSPGVFQRSADGQRVFFVERDPRDEVSVRNIFALSNKEPLETVISARNGRIDVQDDERFLVLESGQRSDVNTTTGETTVAGFESYRALVDIKTLRSVREPPPKTVGTADLMRSPTPRNQGELAWRFGLMLAAVNLSLLAIGLAHVNTRRPSNLNLVVALLGSLAYFNSINLTQSWVANGRFGMVPSLLVLHGGVFLAALALLWWRDHAAVLHFRRATTRTVSA
jgi:lipopolysaccharide export system permease protein